VEDHAPVGGLGDYLLKALVRWDLLGERKFAIFGVEGYPAWGTPAQALGYHGLDGQSLARRIRESF
jgi:transketolase